MGRKPLPDPLQDYHTPSLIAMDKALDIILAIVQVAAAAVMVYSALFFYRQAKKKDKNDE